MEMSGMVKNTGILLIGQSDEVVKSRAAKFGLNYLVSSDYAVPWEKTLIVQAGISIPWDLLPAAWSFLERWDAAVPLWRYGKTAGDLGTKKERELTAAIIRDLRVLVYSHELLFVRKNDAGSALIDQWVAEMQTGDDLRLAFLRAYYQIKPRLCALPISWLADVRSSSASAMRLHHPRNAKFGKSNLVRVEVSPGRFVKCKPGDEERVLQFYQEKAEN